MQNYLHVLHGGIYYYYFYYYYCVTSVNVKLVSVTDGTQFSVAMAFCASPHSLAHVIKCK